MPPVRVLVVATDPLARAGLATLVADTEGLEVVGRASGDDDPSQAIAVSQPDIVLWDAGWQPGSLVDRLNDWIDNGPPMLLLVPQGAEAGSLWAAGARGLLPRTSSAARLAAAVQALDAGLAVIDPVFASVLTVVPDSDSTSPLGTLAEPLTPRELQVLRLIAEGLPNKTIASRLQISEHTVKFHVNAILGKLGAASRTEAVVNATRLGLILL